MIPFALVDVPGSAPYRCACGNGLGVDGPFVSTGLSLGGFSLFLCAACVARVMAPFDAVPKADYLALGERVSAADRRVLELGQELADAQRQLVGVAGREEQAAATIAELRAETRAVAGAALEMKAELDALRVGRVPLQVAANLAAVGVAARSASVRASRSSRTKGAA